MFSLKNDNNLNIPCQTNYDRRNFIAPELKL